jgi:hypothetical protein
MKLTHFLVAAALCSTSAALAQTTPTQTTPAQTDPRTPNTASPSTVPSGTAPAPSNPKGAVSSGEVFTTGAPDGTNTGDKRAMKHSKKDKSSMSDGKGKMKTKM